MLNGPIWPSLKGMVIPMAIGIVTIMFFSMVDTFFISLLGTQPLAALGFCFPIIFVVLNFMMGMVIGLSSVLAKTLGRGRSDQAAQITTDNLFISVLMVIVISAFGLWILEPLFIAMGADEEVLPYIKEYMVPWFAGVALLCVPMVANGAIRASGDMKMSSVIMVLSAIINGILDPFLIFGIGPFPALGVTGAAYATVISWFVTCAFALWVLRRKYQLLRFRLSLPKKLWASIRPVLYIGLPSALSNLLIPAAGGILTAIIATQGIEAVAAFGVGTRVEMIAMVVAMALSAAMTTFVSQNMGAEQPQRIEEAIRIANRFILKFQIGVYLVLLVTSPLIARMFSEDEIVMDLVTLYLFIVALSFPAQGLSLLYGATFTALHRPMDALMLSIARLFVLVVPCAWFGSQLYGIHGFFTGIVMGSVLAALSSHFWLLRYRQNYMINDTVT